MTSLDKLLARVDDMELDKDQITGLWRCSACGEAMEQLDPAWRWTGTEWQHKCPGLDPQAGYFSARWFGSRCEGCRTVPLLAKVAGIAVAALRETASAGGYAANKALAEIEALAEQAEKREQA